VALIIPSGILVYQAMDQLKWQTYHNYRTLAEELSTRINQRFVQLIRDEEARTFADYSFLVVTGDPAVNFVQRSPLAAFPLKSEIPGLIGYFQIDSTGRLSSPVLPKQGSSAANYGISADEYVQRSSLQDQIQRILVDNHLVQNRQAGLSTPLSTLPKFSGNEVDQEVEESGASISAASRNDKDSDSRISTAARKIVGQTLFDQLSSVDTVKQKSNKAAGKMGRIADLKLDYSYQSGLAGKTESQEKKRVQQPFPKRSKRKERTNLPEVSEQSTAEESEDRPHKDNQIRVRTFESEIDPFEFSQLDSGHFVLYRKVWRNDQRFIQGVLIKENAFLKPLIHAAFVSTTLSEMSNLVIAYRGDVLTIFKSAKQKLSFNSTTELGDSLLYQTKLSAPFGDLQLIFSVNQLPIGRSGPLILWTGGILVALLCAGFYSIYRLGSKQISLTEQQQDFVSAVSHELKTPLTSIRMYGEMLREDWAPEEKKKVYYDYIYAESERLSRLINNILQLAQMTRNEVTINLKTLSVAESLDTIRSRVCSQSDRAGFELRISCVPQVANRMLNIDPDAFCQVIINLVDNAIKFSVNSTIKRIDINAQFYRSDKLLFTVRDYGPGIAQSQMKKIFKLFYRSENELTRETIGTGIGLALVHQLVISMQGTVDAFNKDPGVEFRLVFPVVE